MFRDALLSAYAVLKDDITVIDRLENNSKYCTFLL